MAENVWYYATNNVQHGPFTFEEMKTFAREGRFSRTDLVWEPGFGNRWLNAGTVADLFPPPAGDAVEQPPPLSFPETAQAPDAEPAAHPRAPLNGVRGETPSVFRAAALAFRRMRDVLFSTCCFPRWLGIAFCSWLCNDFYLRLPNSLTPKTGTGGIHSGTAQSPDAVFKELGNLFGTAYDTFVQSLHTRVGICIVSLIVCVILLFKLLSFFLQSRGNFMFLHRWYHPDEKIRTVWRNSRYAANRLFRWEVGFFFCFLIAMGLTLAFGHQAVLRPYLANGKAWDARFLVPLIYFVCLALGVLFTYTSARSIVREFIVPVMYWQGCTVGAAWLSFFSLCWQRPFRLLGFYLLMYALFLAWLLVYLLAVIGSLFIGGILLALPYVGAVILLPASFFFRGYSLAFIHQWRKDLVPLE
ncbi:MAG: DUF4339 domain-containing protein [Kiritimatiellae bacterium]|nr:DUF4339 domain-containing protein [Kiritimatiellia bacterium]